MPLRSCEFVAPQLVAHRAPALDMASLDAAAGANPPSPELLAAVQALKTKGNELFAKKKFPAALTE